MKLFLVSFLMLFSVCAFSAQIDPRFMSNGFDTLLGEKTSDDLAEGTTNMYFSEALARESISAADPLEYSTNTGEVSCKTASGSQAGCLSSTDFSTFNGKQDALGFTAENVANKVATADGSMSTSATDYPAEARVKSYVESEIAGVATVVPFKEALTLTSGDITAQYKDMTVECKPSSLTLIVKGASAVAESLDYTVSVVSDKTRITFAGDLATAGATPLIENDVLYCQCLQ